MKTKGLVWTLPLAANAYKPDRGAMVLCFYQV
jgi:hypothetical protein